MYKFSLKIDDDGHSLTKEDGISFDKIGELLQSLYTAIDPQSVIKCTLGQIRGNCYALDFYTEEEKFVENFVVVHKNIEEVSFNDLSAPQKDYAKCLNRVLGDKYYIKAYDRDNKEIAKIKNIGLDKNITDTFYSLKTIYGIVSEIGSTSLASLKKHIRVDGVPYGIKISKDQDLELKPFYGTDKLRIRIKQKRSQERGRVLDAELISFTPTTGNSIVDALKNEGYIDFALIRNTKTIDDIVNRIYKIG